MRPVTPFSRPQKISGTLLTSGSSEFLVSVEMSELSNNPGQVAEDELLTQLASELQRLANTVKKEIKRNRRLASLSGLAAMGPLHAMLTETLAQRLTQPNSISPAVESESPKDTVFPGYV